MPDFARELERKADQAERDARVIRQMLERAPEKAERPGRGPGTD
jgi:hypothetical protein